jgi:AraC-like DNA-binding protein
VIRHSGGSGDVRHERFLPNAQTAALVEHYWSVSWNVPGAPIVAATLPHPSVHVVFEPGKTALSGVHRTRFARTLEGRSFAFGIKFRPASFQALCRRDVSELTDRVVDPRTIFGRSFGPLEAEIFRTGSARERAKAADGYPRRRMPIIDATAQALNALVEGVARNPASARVDLLAKQFGTTVRTLQRLFKRYIGVSPKWVIARYRIHEALALAESQPGTPWSVVALETGYSDQAHFIRDFKALVGETPQTYRRRLEG